MTKVLPTDERITFLVCEDVREEVGNKRSFMGAFTGDDLMLSEDLSKPGDPILAIPLVVVFILKDGEGKFTGRLEILTPDGETRTHEFEQVIKKPNQTATLVVKFWPFPIKSFGIYTMTLVLDEARYSRTFPINHMEKK